MLRAGGDSSPGIVTHTHVFSAFGDTIPGPTAQAGIVGAGGDVGQGDTANGCVAITARVAFERLDCLSAVSERNHLHGSLARRDRSAVLLKPAVALLIERQMAGGRIAAARGVAKECERSSGRVAARQCCFQGQPFQRLCCRRRVFNKSAAVPTAVLLFPLLRSSAPAPTAVLLLPSVLAKSAYQPNAAFAKPVVLLKRAWSPSAVLNGSTLPGSGVACTFGKSPMQRSVSVMRSGGVVLSRIRWTHKVLPFFFPAALILRLRVRKRRRT